MDAEKMDEIVNNRINGNISDFNIAISKLSKLELLDIIEHMRGYHGIPIHTVIAYLRTALSN